MFVTFTGEYGPIFIRADAVKAIIPEGTMSTYIFFDTDSLEVEVPSVDVAQAVMRVLKSTEADKALSDILKGEA